jgi:osmotically-inducible protein OsmY
VRAPILDALRREAAVNADGIDVSVSGTTVTLTGRVHSWYERESVERAAMHAPGITRVDNRLEVVWSESWPDFEGDLC